MAPKAVTTTDWVYRYVFDDDQLGVRASLSEEKRGQAGCTAGKKVESQAGGAGRHGIDSLSLGKSKY